MILILVIAVVIIAVVVISKSVGSGLKNINDGLDKLGPVLDRKLAESKAKTPHPKSIKARMDAKKASRA